MAIALNSSGSGARTAAGTTHTVDITSAATGADCFAWVTMGGTSMASFTMTGWTQVVTGVTGSTTPVCGAVFYRRKVAGDTTFTATSNASGKGSFGWVSYTGLHATTPYQSATSGVNLLAKSVSAATVATPSVTNSDATAWALSFHASRTSASGNKVITFTADAALTERIDQNNSAATSSIWTGVEIADSGGAVTAAAHSYTATASFSEQYGLGALLYLNPSTASNAKVGTFTDDFSGSDISVKWPSSVADAGASVGYSGGTGVINFTSGAYGQFASGIYDFADSGVSIQWASIPALGTGSAHREVMLQVLIDADNKILLFQSTDNGYFGIRLCTASVNDTTYVADSGTWWRIRESGGTVYWEASANGTDWTNLRTLAHTFTASQLGAVQITIIAGDYATGGAASASIDNLNLSGSSTTYAAAGTVAAVSGTAGSVDRVQSAAGVVAAVSATSGAVTIAPPPSFPADDFSSYSVATWAEASTHGPWYVQFIGGGPVQIVSNTGNQALRLESTPPTSSGQTFSSLVTSGDYGTTDTDFTVRMRTTAQLRTGSTPNDWEVAWLCWRFIRLDSTHVRYYYIALKPTNGFELGKVDQSVFTSTGGQRFLWTDSSTTYAIGTTWRTVRVRQVGAVITVWVDGTQKANFTDGPGSGGTPAWGTAGESVFYNGGIGLYQEDSRVEFDDVALTSSGTTYAAAGTVAAVSGTAGNATAASGAITYQASGTVAGISATTGASVAFHPVTGTVAGVTATTGDAARLQPVAGSVAGTTTTSGNPVGLHPVTGTVAGTSGTIGDAARVQPVSGTVAGISGTSGNATVATGAITWAASGTVAGVSATAGNPIGFHPVTGTVAGTSSTTGNPIAFHPITGTVQVISATSGAASLVRPVSGAVAGISATSGAVVGMLQAAGTAAGTSGTSGAIAAWLKASGTVSAVSDTTGTVVAYLTAAGEVAILSGTSGDPILWTGTASWVNLAARIGGEVPPAVAVQGEPVGVTVRRESVTARITGETL